MQAEDWMAYARQMEEILLEFLKEMPQAQDFRVANSGELQCNSSSCFFAS